MRLQKVLLFLLIFSCNYLLAQKPMFERPLSPRIANYEMDVWYDAKEKTIIGTEILTWRNDSEEKIHDLQFHLYLNAFKNKKSTFMRESGGRIRFSSADFSTSKGWITVENIEFVDGINLTDKMEFIHPDDDNENDQTVMRIQLDEPIAPQATIKLKIDFTSQLPQVIARSGYRGDFVLAGQWFPKIGVYEEAGEGNAKEGRWNCHQYHANTEFFADFGVYDVKITLPDNYIVGATGVLLSETQNDDSTKTYNFYCEDVHDFAWTADTDFIIVKDKWKHVEITYLVQPLRDSDAQRQITAMKNSLECFDEWFGEYPYPTITIVDPQYRAFAASGMEYQTFFTAGTFWLFPDAYSFPAEVVAHEFGHNYFQGILASNEFEEAWLDEGMTTYAEMKVMEKYYAATGGSTLNLFGINIYNTEYNWRGYAARPKHDVIVKNAWQYDRGGYGTFSYSKPAMMMLTLENYLGEEKMKQVMHAYFDRFKFKHPTTKDFVNTVNDVSGEDLNGFFDQALYTTKVLDYKIDRITTERIRESNSESQTDSVDSVDVEETGDSLVSESQESDSTKEKDTKYKSRVIVEREGEFIFPVEILVKFQNGDEFVENWDGADRYKIFEYVKNSRLVSAEVDPHRKIWLDVNFVNNGKTIKTNNAAVYKYTSRWLFWMQNILHFISIFG